MTTKLYFGKVPVPSDDKSPDDKSPTTNLQSVCPGLLVLSGSIKCHFLSVTVQGPVQV
jgi:hypothetical protein